MRYQDLPDTPNGRFLYCPTCDDRFSACRGDYFLAEPDEEIRCAECDTPLELVREQRRLVKVKA